MSFRRKIGKKILGGLSKTSFSSKIIKGIGKYKKAILGVTIGGYGLTKVGQSVSNSSTNVIYGLSAILGCYIVFELVKFYKRK